MIVSNWNYIMWSARFGVTNNVGIINVWDLSNNALVTYSYATNPSILMSEAQIRFGGRLQSYIYQPCGTIKDVFVTNQYSAFGIAYLLNGKYPTVFSTSLKFDKFTNYSLYNSENNLPEAKMLRGQTAALFTHTDLGMIFESGSEVQITTFSFADLRDITIDMTFIISPLTCTRQFLFTKYLVKEKFF
jgi:hypothetical protein